MATRSYGSYCGVARALELVGERWALLIVRDLLVGPRRFTDLQRGLPRIPTNVLSTRLKELEQADVVRRRLLPRPGGAIVYELTDRGRALEPAVLALGRWGAPLLGEPGADEIVTADSLVMAIRTTFHPEAARGLHLGYELRVGDLVVHARIDDGALAAAAGPLAGADLVLETERALRALMAGALAPADAIAGGAIRIHGDPALLATFAAVFRIEPASPGATFEG
ncbi:transcriptional regulator, HxlR family [Nannocystis exedens]|uniref:Transcriptional regulator, HxlR family n=1 Tax=Nannocystis exedens TaxID=54 RepID=A0A1I2G5W2_9BACT|nr:helix-turn-helix domain-containing protein [Nannocystis exedens]PCC67300.1 HxlR family transcriptional regulator [Nannocystis exedens]SFF12513.1 transcriptional regulator, HxlR family [Nannocystis exedens]